YTLESRGLMKFFVDTYGCTANQGDSKRIEALLKKEGHEIAESVEAADTVVVNTCIVTKRTELNVLKRLEELEVCGKDIIVAGCLPVARPDLISKKQNYDVMTPRSIDHVFEYGVDGVIGTVNISNGCIGDCSYCIVKKARGPLLSYDLKRIIETVNTLVAGGAKEIRITSQDCSAYGLDTGTRLPELIREISSIEGDFMLRIGMMNPFTLVDILDETIEAFDHPKIFKFLHVPVQSGSDAILKLMNRDHKISEFTEILKRFREKFSDLTISTDFIIGFPGEIEEDFKDSLSILELTTPDKVNITRFSARPGTKAADMPDILERTKKERSRIFTKRCHEILSEKNAMWIGRELNVIVTEIGEKGGVVSRDDTYKHIILRDDLRPGERFRVRITEAKRTYFIGEVLN
ncbi:MAG: tRNA (N(6)-L-threonylcarbamoyladenosine(37)-C(2))-methylthiotransferase, partial [Halobacteriota archaeon]|nr:tRNA (N(6)-L-threonylcarbamoyladenosine(37)-C(2))-methylthiotransferase [Halobacteriota archaeon]